MQYFYSILQDAKEIRLTLRYEQSDTEFFAFVDLVAVLYIGSRMTEWTFDGVAALRAEQLLQRYA